MLKTTNYRYKKPIKAKKIPVHTRSSVWQAVAWIIRFPGLLWYCCAALTSAQSGLRKVSKVYLSMIVWKYGTVLRVNKSNQEWTNPRVITSRSEHIQEWTLDISKSENIQEWSRPGVNTSGNEHVQEWSHLEVNMSRSEHVQEWTRPGENTSRSYPVPVTRLKVTMSRSQHVQESTRPGVNTSSREHVQKWTHSEVNTSRSEHVQEWTRSEVNTSRSEHVQEWTHLKVQCSLFKRYTGSVENWVPECEEYRYK